MIPSMILRWLTAIGLGLLFLSGCRGSSLGPTSSQAAAPPSAPYPLAPLLSSLRPEQVASLRRQTGVDDLTDLPYYDLDLALDGAGEELAGRYLLYYRNRTGRELAALPFLLHANTPRELGGGTDAPLVSLREVRALEGPAVNGIDRRRLTLAEVRFARPVRIGERIKLEVKFSGKLRQLPPGSNDIFGQAFASLGVSGSGAAASDYGLLASGDGILTVASAYPIAAPYRRGGFDVSKPSKFGDLAYNELCNFRVRVAVPPGYLVVTNLRDLPGQQRTPSGALVHTAVGAANRDLVVVAGRDLRRRSQSLGPIKVTSIYKRGDERGGELALKTGIASLRLFQERFGPYPWTELDVAEATLVGGAGGVEFPGMVLIAGMLYRPPSKSSNPLAQLMRLVGGLGGMLGGALGDLDGKQAGKGKPQGLRDLDAMIREMAAFTIAHEVAHQYFAGLVGSDCRNDPAVDEPLAQFAAAEYARHAFGAAEGNRIMEQNVKLNYGIYRLLGGKDRPAAQPVRDFPSALSYAAIVYGKAPYFYEALRKKLGAARFARAIRAAVDQSRFKIISLDEWVLALERHAGGPASGVRPLAARWFRGRFGDQDLGVDAEGDVVLSSLLGKEIVTQLKQGLGLLGMHPRDLFRMMMGKLLGDEEGARGPTRTGSGDLQEALKEMQKLLR
jgi:hypothetical protein